MSVDASDLMAVTKAVTKDYTKQRKAEERGRRSRASRQYVYSDRVYFSQVAAEILPKGYAHASGNGEYTVDKRQLYYACRQAFLDKTGREITADYFSQTLLVKFMNHHPNETASWKITASPRGTLTIPNTDHDCRIPCGTVAIEEHLAKAARILDPTAVNITAPVEWPSLAENQRYRAVLYIEKEGFDPQLREAGIAERFDLCIVSCKGQSVIAARRFVDHVCRINGGVPLFTLHDFDPSGFVIAQRLTGVSHWARCNDLVKYEFQNDIDVTDLGLRLADVEAYGLQSEDFTFRGLPDDIEATSQEREFFESGKRVELNAFTAPDFIEWLETKLRKHLPGKFVPADDVLESAWRHALIVAKINETIAEAHDDATRRAKAAKMPRNLRVQLAKSAEPWDKALYEVAKKQAFSWDAD